VQTFLPSPMATATAMYHSGRNPLRKLRRDGEIVPVAKGAKARRLHKAFLRYHDPANWPLLRQALRQMGRADLIGNGPEQLIPLRQPAVGTSLGEPAAGGGTFLTQHARRPQRSGPRRAR
jgi:hypothetical protein